MSKRTAEQLEALDALPEEEKREFTGAFLLRPARPGAPADLLRFAGTLDDASAAEMRDAIEEACESINSRGW